MTHQLILDVPNEVFDPLAANAKHAGATPEQLAVDWLAAMSRQATKGASEPKWVGMRIEELRLLKDGWLDGNGVALSPDGLDWLARTFDSNDPNGMTLPYLFPTPEGRVLAEWSLKSWSWSPSLEIDLATKRGEWHALNIDTNEEASKELDLKDTNAWAWLAEQIRALGGVAE